MAEPLSFTEQAERLKLRVAPRPVARLNRKVLIASAGIGALLLFAAASVALDPPKLNDDEPKELYNTTHKGTPDALAALPKSYADVKQSAPILGPPLPGDLGLTVFEAERDLGVDHASLAPQDYEYRPNAEDDAARAQVLRQAKLGQDSLEAPVFFQLKGAGKGDAGASPFPANPSAGSELSALNIADRFGASIEETDRAADANFQSAKVAFAGGGRASQTTNPHAIEDPVSPFAVMAGTVIPASLITGLNSDLPGTIVAQVTERVFDSATGAHLLIPQGARLIGRYDSRVAFGQDRALIVWDRIIFPDGASILIDALPGADAAGYAGLNDRVDHHWGRLFAAAGLATLLSVGTELSFGDDESNLVQAVREASQDNLSRAGRRIVDRNLDIQPTLRVRPGWPLRVIVTRDLVLRPNADPGAVR